MSSQPRKAYLTDLTDDQWTILQPLLPAAKPGGRPRDVDLREVINTILYLNRTGCQWDLLPHDLLPKSTAYDYFAQWRDDGTWTRLVDALRGSVRTAAGREATPSAGSIDSQSVKTTEVGGARGYDGSKKIKGRKRHVFVDTLGLLLAVVVTGAAVDDGVAAPAVLERLRPASYPRLQKLWGDRKYHNYDLRDWLSRHRPGWELEIQTPPPERVGFAPIPKRWVVERTFAWLGRCRRHSKDYERRTDSSEAMAEVSAMHLMLRRLKPDARAVPFRYRQAA